MVNAQHALYRSFLLLRLDSFSLNDLVNVEILQQKNIAENKLYFTGRLRDIIIIINRIRSPLTNTCINYVLTKEPSCNENDIKQNICVIQIMVNHIIMFLLIILISLESTSIDSIPTSYAHFTT